MEMRKDRGHNQVSLACHEAIHSNSQIEDRENEKKRWNEQFMLTVPIYEHSSLQEPTVNRIRQIL